MTLFHHKWWVSVRADYLRPVNYRKLAIRKKRRSPRWSSAGRFKVMSMPSGEPPCIANQRAGMS